MAHPTLWKMPDLKRRAEYFQTLLMRRFDGLPLTIPQKWNQDYTLAMMLRLPT
jgi:hypothetical protein